MKVKTPKAYKRSELKKFAEELNQVLGLQPPINLDAKTSELLEILREAALLVDLKHDDLTDATRNFVAAQIIATDPEEIKEQEVDVELEGEVTDRVIDDEALKKGKDLYHRRKDQKAIPRAPRKETNACKKIGIVATIIELLKEAGDKGITKREILNKLVMKFPDREPDSMHNTVNCQVPYRLIKNKGLNVWRGEEGRYYLLEEGKKLEVVEKYKEELRKEKAKKASKKAARRKK